VARGADAAKDQSYVLSMLGQDALGRVRFPVGSMTKAGVRARAAALDLRTATKPDSQEVCFVPAASTGRVQFLSRRIPMTAGRVVDTAGTEIGTVPAVEAVTVGQRRGLALSGAAVGGQRRYVLSVDAPTATVTVGGEADLLVEDTALGGFAWSSAPVQGPVLGQCSAHGPADAAELAPDGLRWSQPRRRVAPGQTVAFYDPEAPDQVLGSAIAV
jgi:tRNA-specific 2-thiouridylase